MLWGGYTHSKTTSGLPVDSLTNFEIFPLGGPAATPSGKYTKGKFTTDAGQPLLNTWSPRHVADFRSMGCSTDLDRFSGRVGMSSCPLPPVQGFGFRRDEPEKRPTAVMLGLGRV